MSISYVVYDRFYMLAYHFTISNLKNGIYLF